jgi:hypothetical protein
MPHVVAKGQVVVTLSAQEVRSAIEHAAWCAAVDNDPSIAVRGFTQIERHGDGYRVTYTKIETR